MSDSEKLANMMGQYEAWCGKLFYYHGPNLGYRFIKDL